LIHPKNNRSIRAAVSSGFFFNDNHGSCKVCCQSNQTTKCESNKLSGVESPLPPSTSVPKSDLNSPHYLHGNKFYSPFAWPINVIELFDDLGQVAS
jgi:hypothetical protein